MLLRISSLFVLFLLPACQTSAQVPADSPDSQRYSPETTGVCLVERVVDGDTVHCAGGESIRLLLIDTPEMAQEPFGTAARAALQELLAPGDEVRLEFDVQRRDRYGRLLAHIHTADGIFVNEAMARSGYAVALVYQPNVKHVERIRAAVAEARAAGRGLWAVDAFRCTPREWRAARCGG